MSKPVNDKVMEALRRETAYEQSTSKGGRRVKLEKGQSWIIRFLPAKMGPDGLWFARIAQHWHNRKPILCIRHTSPDYHGDPEYDCPVCSMAEALNDDPNKEISQTGFKAQANPNWLTYCLVFEKNGEPVSNQELLLPYEFNMGRGVWDILKNIYQTGLRKGPNSVLDYHNGNEFSLMRNAQGYALDKQDSSPIFDPSDRNFDSYIAKIEAQLKAPKVTVPTEKELHIFANKLEEDALDLRGSSRSPRRDRDRDSGDDDVPRRRPAPSDDEPVRSSRHRSPAPEADEPPRRRPVDERQAPRSARNEDPVPAPRRPATATSSPTPSRGRPTVDPDDDVPYGNSDPEGDPEPAPDGDEPSESAPERRSVTKDDLRDLPPATTRRGVPAPASAPRQQHADVEAGHVDPGADEEIVPEEAVDSAPPAESVLPADESSPAEEPPPVRRKLGTALRQRMEARS